MRAHDAQVVELTLAGLTQPEIACKLGLSVSQVKRSRKRTGTYSPNQHSHGGGRPAVSVERVVELTKQNYSQRQIADMLGCTERTVIRARVKAGIAQTRAPMLTPEQLSLAENLITDGASIAEAARTIGCNVNTAYRHFKGRGFTRAEAAQYSSLVRSLRRRGLQELIA